MSDVTQTRITLRALKVAKFASQETLCYTATVLLDGRAIAEARNEGHGGMTLIGALEGMQRQLKEAERFAKSLPPHMTEYPDPKDPSRNLQLPMSLDMLVDGLASQELADRDYRRLFNRDMRTKISFVVGDDLRYLQNVKPSDCTAKEISAYCARIRSKHGADTQILLQMPREEAFALWKKILLKKPVRH